MIVSFLLFAKNLDCEYSLEPPPMKYVLEGSTLNGRVQHGGIKVFFI